MLRSKSIREKRTYGGRSERKNKALDESQK